MSQFSPAVVIATGIPVAVSINAATAAGAAAAEAAVDAAMATVSDLIASAIADLDLGINFVSPPASTSGAGTSGQIAYDGTYLYLCVATNTWLRASLNEW